MPTLVNTIKGLVVLIISLAFVLSCGPNEKSKKVTIGSATFICIYIAPLDWSSSGLYKKLSIEVKADKLSKIKVPNAWTSSNYSDGHLFGAFPSVMDSYASNLGVGITLGSMGVLSFQRVYREVLDGSVSQPTSQPTSVPTQQPTSKPSSQPSVTPTLRSIAKPSSEPSFSPNSFNGTQTTANHSTIGQHRILLTHNNTESNVTASSFAGITFPILFGIIDVENGVVKNVIWDNFCHWCDPLQCLPNTLNYDKEFVPGEGSNCFVYDTDCIHRNEGNETISALCELTIYIAWHGTDSSGANFVSGSSRFSRWSANQIRNFTESLKTEVQPAAFQTIKPKDDKNESSIVL